MRGTMAEDAARLKKMTVAELRALAKESGVDVGGLKTKAQIVERLSSPAAPPAPAPVEAPAPPTESGPKPPDPEEEAARTVFEAVPLAMLKRVAKVFDVRVKGSGKNAHVDALAVHERRAEIAARVRDLAGIQGDTRAVARVGKDLERIQRQVQVPDVRDPEADSLLESALKASIDFAGAEDHLDQASRWYAERLYDRTAKAAEEALSAAWLTYDAFLNSVWAHGLLAAQHMILDAANGGADVQAAVPILLEAKRLFREGQLAENRGVVVKLTEMVRLLYTEEMRLSREALHENTQIVRQAGELGADVRLSDDILDAATKAAQSGDHPRAMTLAGKAGETAKASLAAKRQEVWRQLEAVARAVDATRHLAADVHLADEALAAARRALEAGQLPAASEFVSRAELQAQMAIQARAGTPAQPSGPRTLATSPAPPGTPAPPPVSLSPAQQQVADSAKQLLANIAPVFDEADHYSIDVTAGRQAMVEAQQALQAGNVDGALAAARRAGEVSRNALKAILAERAKERIVKPTEGKCGRCQRLRLEFFDDGWGRCLDCGNVFRWRQVPARETGLFGRRKR